MMSAPEVMPQTMQSFQYLNYAAQYQQQRLNFANGYHQSGPGLHDTPSVSAHESLSTMNPVSVSAPSVLDPATQLGHLNAAITKLEPQLPVAPTGHSTPASTSPNQPTQEQSLPMTPPRPNAMEPLVESFYEKDIEEELDEHFKKSQSETKTRRGLIFPASYYQQQTSPAAQAPASAVSHLHHCRPRHRTVITVDSLAMARVQRLSLRTPAPHRPPRTPSPQPIRRRVPTGATSYNSSLNLTAGVGTYNQSSLFPSTGPTAATGLDQLGANQSPFQAAAAGFRSY
ncbi:Oidioi.mRNA.OKI2018_I69.chr2.g7431.t1.cds [Oikopleura dioica]|uniref:Oidioi.mRNA.OKI2018_I69.chr2.g7431.t1.cds n=1 Tax=Oikopleura dioica TaxID=34765 RepID=A0ABN7TAY2_OIKDI|nr:Oidioi.mRNA.OKI2018_I69.chr2.g7431.t1.cds [Oikopleura dioica]